MIFFSLTTHLIGRSLRNFRVRYLVLKLAAIPQIKRRLCAVTVGQLKINNDKPYLNMMHRRSND